MKFLDKKEQVLELQMTQFGKNALSRGGFNPSYYAFFDDDVVYDSKYMARNEEGTDDVLQLETSTRISSRISDAIRPEAQANYAGVESAINNLQKQEIWLPPWGWVLANVDTQTALVNLAKPPNPIDSYYSQGLPMGTSAHDSSKAPAFNLNFHSGEITNLNLEVDALFYTGSGGFIKIPQLDVEAIYEARIHGGPPPSEPQENTDIKVWPDDSYIEVKGTSILIDVGELNSLFEHENFDIEVYEVEEKKDFPHGGPQIEYIDFLRPLYFKKKNPAQEGLYDNSEMQTSAQTKDNVEHYFEISVDDEILEEESLNSVISSNLSSISGGDIYDTPTNDNKGPC